MSKIIFLLVVMAATLSAHADMWSTYPHQAFQPYQQYQSQAPFQSVQSMGYAGNQLYGLQDAQGYYQNPYQTQCQGQYINPYQYQRPYGSYSPYSVMNSALSGLGSGGGAQQVVKNIGQSVLYSMLRGY